MPISPAAAKLRASFPATAAGIVAAFLALAGALVALKSAGSAIGWGIQFQQPVFLALMGLVLTLFAANLWGLLEIRLPASTARARAAGARNGDSRRRFFTGAFATLLATPCSAPFVGTAIGFALARGPAEIFAIFLALGVGLALPYLAIATAQELVAGCRGPGAGCAGSRRCWAVSFWHRVRLIATSAADRPPHRRRRACGDIRLARLRRAAIAVDVADGRVVFVDVTADWCVTCQVNKSLVLERGRSPGAWQRPTSSPCAPTGRGPTRASRIIWASLGATAFPSTRSTARARRLPAARIAQHRSVLAAIEQAAKPRTKRTARGPLPYWTAV